jgi:3-methyladenine DNA glycosylase AlkD
MEAIQRALAARANAKTRQWWERYMRGAIPFRGVPMGGIREVVTQWAAGRDRAEIRATALELMRQRYSEDKIAGVLIFAEILPATRRDLPDLARLFAENAINDWSTCDWLCVKVLGPLIEREGLPAARAIVKWKSSKQLWQRRAAAVAFVNLAKRGAYADQILEACEALVTSEERFAQTGVGWVLRELKAAEPERVAAFVEKHRAGMSKEALRRISSGR